MGAGWTPAELEFEWQREIAELAQSLSAEGIREARRAASIRASIAVGAIRIATAEANNASRHLAEGISEVRAAMAALDAAEAAIAQRQRSVTEAQEVLRESHRMADESRRRVEMLQDAADFQRRGPDIWKEGE